MKTSQTYDSLTDADFKAADEVVDAMPVTYRVVYDLTLLASVPSIGAHLEEV